MSIWSDFYKLFAYAGEKDPLAKKIDKRNLTGAGVIQPDAIPRMDGETALGNNLVSLRETSDMVDLQSINGRIGRLMEYERIRSIPEVEMVITTISDEACLAGPTPVITPFGPISIEELTRTKSPEERFLVYSWSFEKNDYSLAWAYNPRFVKNAETVHLLLDDGTDYYVTPDHRVLLNNGNWTFAGQLKFGDKLKPFYRVKPNPNINKLKTGQFPRIFTNNQGWITERQFVDEWRTGKLNKKAECVRQVSRMIGKGLTAKQVVHLVKKDWKTLKLWLAQEGFTFKELKHLRKKYELERTVIGVYPDKVMPVYDLSVEKDQCFASTSCIFHNCQKDENGNVFKITCGNEAVKKELDFVFFNRGMMNVNRRTWDWFQKLIIKGDLFLEKIIDPDNPEQGIQNIVDLPAETMFRIETTKGKLVEFQQSKEGPDYQALMRTDVTQANDNELKQSTAIRFHRKQITHIRIGGNRQSFYPYGVSIIEPARGAAHQLRLMEDAMVTYRLVRAPERRVFYIDCGTLTPNKATAYIERLKDQLRKRKVASQRGTPGANQVEERWMPPPVDEDIWVPTRPNSNTRIDTLPGAQNLGEIDDAVYFRQKLFMALNFPLNYTSDADPNATRVSLSARDIKFAHMIERLQAPMEDGMLEIAEHHLELMGFPPELYEDLKIKMTPPSDWRELSRAEVTNDRLNKASTYKSGQLLSDYDILIDVLKYSEEEAREKIARNKIQRLEELKLQIIAQNPALIGIGIPGVTPHPGQEMGTEPGGPAPALNPDDGQPPAGGDLTMPAGGDQPMDQAPEEEPGSQGMTLEIPSKDDIKKYDLEIQDYESEQDEEPIDYSLGD